MPLTAVAEDVGAHSRDVHENLVRYTNAVGSWYFTCGLPDMVFACFSKAGAWQCLEIITNEIGSIDVEIQFYEQIVHKRTGL